MTAIPEKSTRSRTLPAVGTAKKHPWKKIPYCRIKKPRASNLLIAHPSSNVIHRAEKGKGYGKTNASHSAPTTQHRKPDKPDNPQNQNRAQKPQPDSTKPKPQESPKTSHTTSTTPDNPHPHSTRPPLIHPPKQNPTEHQKIIAKPQRSRILTTVASLLVTVSSSERLMMWIKTKRESEIRLT
jgi:hypothetical protein